METQFARMLFASRWLMAPIISGSRSRSCSCVLSGVLLALMDFLSARSAKR